MNQTWMLFVDWLARTALGGAAVLLVAWMLMRSTRQPVRQLRIGVVGLGSALMLALLSLAPAWLVIPVSWHAAEPAARQQAAYEKPAPTEDRPAPLLSTPQLPPENSLAMAAPHDTSTFKPVYHEQEPATAANDAPKNNFAIHRFAPVQLARNNEPTPGSHALPLPTQDPVEESLPSGAMTTLAPEAPAPPAEFPWAFVGYLVVAGYFAVACLLLIRLLLGLAAPSWILRGAQPAGPEIQELFDQALIEGRRPRLLVARGLSTPMSCGLFRPTVALPASMAADPDAQKLRWVFAHELAHLRRRDPWVCLLFGLGTALFFFVPWFWSLRRQVRLCQEYLADDYATQESPPEDYARFLLSLSAASALPAGAFGVSGNRSDLFRRVTMLLGFSDRFEQRCPRLWALGLGSGLLTLAVLVSGVGLKANAALAQEKEEAKKEEVKKSEEPKTEAKKEEPKAETKKAEEPKVEPRTFFRRAGGPDLPGLPDEVNEQMKQMQRQQAQMMRKMMRARGGMPGGLGGFDNHLFPERGRLGVIIDEPSPTLVSQLDLPKGQGLVIEEVQGESPAFKAGLKQHDILLEFNGKPVPSEPEEFTKLVAEVKAKTPVDAVVLRKGKKETIKSITMAEMKEPANNFPGFPGNNLPNFGVVAPPLQAIPAPIAPGGNFGFGAGAGQGVMTTTFRNNDNFTTRHQEGSLVITVTGKVADGKAKVNEIKVQDGAESHKYESVDKVAEQYRDKVKNLVDMSEKGSVKIEIKQRD
jgi:beta-lactamase regulating signal transducer with metallopeptidase domain